MGQNICFRRQSFTLWKGQNFFNLYQKVKRHDAAVALARPLRIVCGEPGVATAATSPGTLEVPLQGTSVTTFMP